MPTNLYDPRGSLSNADGRAAPRVAGLAGLRLGVLNNTKWNAARLLNEVVSMLGEEESFSAVNYFKKETYTRVADPALLAQLAAGNDIALIAVGD